MFWFAVAAGCALITSPTHKPQLAARRAFLPRAVPTAKSVEFCFWKERNAEEPILPEEPISTGEAIPDPPLWPEPEGGLLRKNP